MLHITEFWKFYLTVSLGLNFIWFVTVLLKQKEQGKVLAKIEVAKGEGFTEGVNEAVKVYEEKQAQVVTTQIRNLPQMNKDARKAGFTKKPKASIYFAERWGVSYTTAMKRINAMIEEGYVEKVGNHKNTAYKLVD